MERVGRRESVRGGQSLDLLAKLRRQLVVVGCDQRPPEEREAVRRDGVDGSPHEVSEHEVAAVDRVVIALTGKPVVPCRESDQSGVPGEVGGGADRRVAEAPRVATRQARTGESEGQDLLGVHGGSF